MSPIAMPVKPRYRTGFWQEGTMSEPKRSTDDGMKSLTKVVRILDCFSNDRRSLSLVEVCERTGFPRSTTHRLLASMREVGFLDQDRERDRYRLGIKLFEYGSMVLSNLELHREARPFVDALNRMTEQSVHLAVFDGHRAVVIHREQPAPGGVTPINLLENAPVHCTSIGKAILAYQAEEILKRVIEEGLQHYTEATIVSEPALREELSRVRSRGYAVDNGEHQPGLRCVGAPIHDRAGRVFASISVSASAWNSPIDKEGELAKIVIHHAQQISHRLGYIGPPTQQG